MNYGKKKLIIIFIAVISAIAITVTAAAVNGGKTPSVQAGKFENLIADRIEITLENTEFVLTRSSQATETFTLTMFLTAKKTQADFYAIINSFSLTGIEYESIVFTALNSISENKTLDGLILTASENTPDVFTWQIDVTLKMAGNGTFNPLISLEYTSGLTEDTSVQKLMEIPLSIKAQ